MIKVFVLLFAFMAVSVNGFARRGPPSPEEMKAALVAAGVSDAGATGILRISAKYRDQFAANRGNFEAARGLFQQMRSEIDGYVQTLSRSDQAAHAAFIQKMMSEHRRKPPTPEEAKAALVAAGISPAGAAGISAIGAKYMSQFAANRGNPGAGKGIFQKMKAEIDAYVQTLSPADQAAHAAFLQKMMAGRWGRHGNGNGNGDFGRKRFMFRNRN